MKITYFNPSYEALVVRLYLMMTVVVGSFYLGVPALSILGIPIFIGSMLGLKIEATPKNENVRKTISTVSSAQAA